MIIEPWPRGVESSRGDSDSFKMDENDIRLRTGCTGGNIGGASASRPFCALSSTAGVAVVLVVSSLFRLVDAGAEFHVSVCLLVSIGVERGGASGGC